jgi:signal transduction histidine kinase
MRRATIRVRLTVLYGGLFFLAGAVLLTVMYLLVKQNLDNHLGTASGVAFSTSSGQMNPGEAAPTVIFNGRPVAVGDLAGQITQQQNQVRDDTLNTLLVEGGVALLVIGVVGSGFGWLMAERALRPVHGITETARRVAAGGSAQRGLHERIALAGPRDEIKELADTFDEMLERLDRSFDGQRRFVANASHELRTPLAINRALVEVAVTRPGASEDARRLGESLLAVNSRHERLIDGLLTLAESEQQVAERSTVDMADVAGHVLDQAAATGLTVHRRLEPAPTQGDPILLERLTQNLLENAIRYNEPGGWLSVHTGQIDGWAALTVTNTGPPVAGYELETIFEPFRRLGTERRAACRSGDQAASDSRAACRSGDQAASDSTNRSGAERGFGLGLSIVRAVARAHGGEVAALSRPGGGLCITVRVPAAALGAARGRAEDRRAALSGVGVERGPGGVAVRSAGR